MRLTCRLTHGVPYHAETIIKILSGVIIVIGFMSSTDDVLSKWLKNVNLQIVEDLQLLQNLFELRNLLYSVSTLDPACLEIDFGH